jgi:hypothetical protein
MIPNALDVLTDGARSAVHYFLRIVRFVAAFFECLIDVAARALAADDARLNLTDPRFLARL